MDHILCRSCGHKALPVATRCPRCGQPFETRGFQQSTSSSKSHRILVGLLVAAAVAVVVLVGKPRPAPPLPEGVLPERPPLPVVESVPPSPTQAEPRPQPPPSTSTSPTTDSAPAPAPAPPRPPTPIVAAEPGGLGQPERRFANTWVNLRAGRNHDSAVVRTLSPGDAVLVDSLRQGWYRVVAGGETVGYVDRSFLDLTPR